MQNCNIVHCTTPTGGCVNATRIHGHECHDVHYSPTKEPSLNTPMCGSGSPANLGQMTIFVLFAQFVAPQLGVHHMCTPATGVCAHPIGVQCVLHVRDAPKTNMVCGVLFCQYDKNHALHNCLATHSQGPKPANPLVVGGIRCEHATPFPKFPPTPHSCGCQKQD
jgi:hypothetical protein